MQNPFTLAGKTVLVTGASSGIGRGIAIACAGMGARVILTARNQVRLQETLSQMEGEGHLVFCNLGFHIQDCHGHLYTYCLMNLFI